MADTHLTPEERDAFAAELALGLLDGEDRAEALRGLMADPDFTPDMIDAWHQRLEPLYEHYVPVRPPETLWAGIQSRIADPSPQSDSVLRQLRLWRGSAIVAGALAASLALVMLLRPMPPVPFSPSPKTSQVAVAQMTGSPDGPVILARYDPATGDLILRPTGVKAGALTPELWVIPADGKPRSLGLISGSSDSHIVVGATHRAFMGEGATLAVTMEIATGAPHDAPTSTPVAAGKISLI